jgi:FkbM family methyltransferase
MIITYHNTKFDLNPFDSYHRGALVQAINYKIGRRKFWQEPTQRLCRQFLQAASAPILVDIGCNIGLFSLPLAKAFPQATIFAVDAYPTPAAAFLRHCKLNDLNNIVQIQAAISTSQTLVQIHECPTNSGGHRLSGFAGRDDLRNQHLHSVTVSSVPLKVLFQHFNLARCDLLKIDTEGQEHDILISLGDQLRPLQDGQGIRAVIAEYGSEGLRAAGTSAIELWRFMDQRGFQAQIIQSGQTVNSAADIPSLPPFEILDFVFTPKDMS